MANRSYKFSEQALGVRFHRESDTDCTLHMSNAEKNDAPSCYSFCSDPEDRICFMVFIVGSGRECQGLLSKVATEPV
jgi:hypothetical protein